MNLTAASGAEIIVGTGTGTIINDDTAIGITDAVVLEGHSGTRTLTFTVNLAVPSALPVSVGFASIDGTASAGADYNAISPGTLDFAPGETSKTIDVATLGDILVEQSETFSIVLRDATNAAIDRGTGVGTILDDDVTLLSARKAIFTDVDGERVIIKVSKGALRTENFTIVPAGLGAQLALVDFSGEAAFTGTSLKIIAKAEQGGIAGDGLTTVGCIDATGVALKRVQLNGDLGRIDAGNGIPATPGIRVLRANSLGSVGLVVQLPGGSSASHIAGTLHTLKLSESLENATLAASDDIGVIKIGGSVLGGAIRSDGRIGSIEISGDLVASEENAATLSAVGITAPKNSAKAVAIGSISIGGSVVSAQILAGYDRSGLAANPEAGIGSVRVGGNWQASDLVAGVISGADGFFGTDDDEPISRQKPIAARIAELVIKGTAVGTAEQNDHFGIVAGQVDRLKADGVRIPLTPGSGNDLGGVLVGTSDDLSVREVI